MKNTSRAILIILSIRNIMSKQNLSTLIFFMSGHYKMMSPLNTLIDLCSVAH